MPEYIVNEKDVEWIRSSVFPGTASKILAVDPDTMAHTMFVRWDPGVEFPLHAHPSVEQIYALEGECEHEGKVYGPGTHFVFTGGHEHGPMKIGDEGWVTLIAFSGSSGLEEIVPEVREHFESIGVL